MTPRIDARCHGLTFGANANLFDELAGGGPALQLKPMVRTSFYVL